MSWQTCTMPSQDGRYWASFSEKSFTRGRRFKVYSGIFNGDGTKRGDKCVVKVFKEQPGTRTLCTCEVKKSSKAKEMAKEFNKLQGQHTRIQTTSLYWASIDEVSVLKKLFFSGRRKLTTKEVVLFEDDLRVDEEKPGKLQKLTLYLDSLGRHSCCKAKDLEAFAHFSYHHSGGDLVLCGLEGVHDTDGFVIKTPTVHSRHQVFGKCDLGVRGIERFFDNHICNDVCRDMMKYNKEESLDFAEEETLRILEEKRVSEPSTPCPPSSTRMSAVTEHMSDYLEPSAPQDLDESCFQPDFAGWMLREHAMRPKLQTPMSIDEGESCKSYPRGNLNERPIVDSPGSPSVYASSMYSSMGQPESLRPEQGRKVHFSMSVGATSGIETATHLTGDTNAGDSSPTTYPRSSLRRQCSAPPAPIHCSSPCEASLARMVFLHSQGAPRCDDIIPVYALPEEPPSYTESQMKHCRDWIMQHHAEMAGPLQRLSSVDSNGNRLAPNLASPRHL